jgi:hypothetical protein
VGVDLGQDGYAGPARDLDRGHRRVQPQRHAA